MKIGIVTQKVVRGDGQGRVNYEIARYALSQGNDVTLITSAVDDSLLAAGAKWVPVRPRVRTPNIITAWEFAQRANTALKPIAGDLDIIHGNGCSLDLPHQVNAAHFVHGAWLKSPAHISHVRKDLYGAYQWTYTAVNARWERSVFQKARKVVAVSDGIRRELMEIGVPAERIEVIYNGVDLLEFHPGSEDRASLGLPKDVVLALFTGDIRSPRKNLDTVLKALVHAPGVHLAIGGKTDGSPYPQLAKDLGVGDRAHFLGFRRDVAKLMRAADLFVFPSRYEACSLAILEAMASGLPIVTASTAGATDLITQDLGVVLEDPNDEQALAKAIIDLSSDPQRRRSMGLAARGAAENHGWDSMAQSYLDVYGAIASKVRETRQPSIVGA
ncbi:glycosyl transferase [Capsulimonas corticalis]|uniref:Glycosyl transferase n=1 Tax=Capsulimonas corticalis TaxID=2219043 RepID=A0A402CNY2_9BACT|nr:glycosyltransferase family 4 protein [Capsulimonas corticalis]BDI33116.1 glycosyl transferase [Capsulimonas corticalis]